jgi:hypothetical protein
VIKLVRKLGKAVAPPSIENPVYDFTLSLGGILQEIFHWKFYGRRHVPKNGGSIVIANHSSHYDPFLIFIAILRRIFTMTRDEFFHPYKYKNSFEQWWEFPLYKYFNWLLPYLGAFPIRRWKPDVNSLKTALSLLELGNVIVNFPEGKESGNGNILPIDEICVGPIWLAKRASLEKDKDIGIVTAYILVPGATHEGYRPYAGPVRVITIPEFYPEQIFPGRYTKEMRLEYKALLHSKLSEAQGKAWKIFGEPI